MDGPGKYDQLATYVREQAQAEGVVVMVHRGDKGSGFSVQGPLPYLLKLPELLRLVADAIEEGRMTLNN